LKIGNLKLPALPVHGGSSLAGVGARHPAAAGIAGQWCLPDRARGAVTY